MPTTTSALRWGSSGLGGAGLRGLLWIGVGLLGACGYFGGSRPVSAAHAPPGTQAPAPLNPAANALAGMVEAVGPSSTQLPVELRFSIHDRPQVGRDDEIDYALVPQVAGIDSIRVVFASLDGLDVVNQGPPLAAVKPAPGVPIFGSVTVRPLKTGLFTLTATVGVGSPSQSVVWPFTIPVIAADGPAQTAANQP